MKINLKKCMNLILFILVGVIVCGGYFTILGNERQAICLSAIAVITFLVHKKTKIKLAADLKIWTLLFGMMIISLIYSVSFQDSFRFIICFGLLIVFKLCIDNIEDWKKVALKSLYIFSSIHVISTLIYAVFPDVVQSIAKFILTPTAYTYNVNLYRYGCIAGICSDHGANAIFITIFIAISFILLLKRKKSRDIIFTLMGVTALLLTGKRGHLIANLIAILATFILYNKNNKKVLKNSLGIALGIIAVLFIIKLIPATSFVFERFSQLATEENILNGREDLYSVMINNIKNNPLIGTGIRTTVALNEGNDGHNIYLQIFSELGIIGLVLLLVVLISNLIKNLKEEKNEYVLTSIYYQIFFLIYGLTGNPLYYVPTLVVYFIMTANKEEEV